VLGSLFYFYFQSHKRENLNLDNKKRTTNNKKINKNRRTTWCLFKKTPQLPAP